MLQIEAQPTPPCTNCMPGFSFYSFDLSTIYSKAYKFLGEKHSVCRMYFWCLFLSAELIENKQDEEHSAFFQTLNRSKNIIHSEPNVCIVPHTHHDIGQPELKNVLQFLLIFRHGELKRHNFGA